MGVTILASITLSSTISAAQAFLPAPVVLLALENSLKLACVSSLLIVILGCFFAWMQSKELLPFSKSFKVLALFNFSAPATLPCLSISSIAALSDLTGFWAIVSVYLWMNVLFASLDLASIFNPVGRYHRRSLRVSFVQKLVLFLKGHFRSLLLPQLFFYFLLCFVSFTPVVLLGDGPSTTTLTVYLFQLLHHNYSPSYIVEAIVLICGVLVLAAYVRNLYVIQSQDINTAHQQKMKDQKGAIQSFKNEKLSLAKLVRLIAALMVLGVFTYPYVDVVQTMQIRHTILFIDNALFALGVSMILAFFLLAVPHYFLLSSYRKAEKRLHQVSYVGAFLFGVPKVVMVCLAILIIPTLYLDGFWVQFMCFSLLSLAVFMGLATSLASKFFQEESTVERYQMFMIPKTRWKRIFWYLFKVRRLQSMKILFVLLAAQVGSATIPVFLGFDQLPLLGTSIFYAIKSYEAEIAASGLFLQLFILILLIVDWRKAPDFFLKFQGRGYAAG